MPLLIAALAALIAALYAAKVYFKDASGAAARKQYHAFLPGAIWKDDNGVHINAHGGGILYDGGRYYWFGEHKVKGDEGNLAQVGVHCYSSGDLYNWKDEGIAFAVTAEENSEVAKGCILERPKVVYSVQTGKYVMWFHLEAKGQGYNAAKVAVATSNQVTGPYSFLCSYRPNAGIWPIESESFNSSCIKNNELSLELAGNEEKAKQGYFLRRDFAGGQMSRDMTIFTDDDGKAYLICASEENFTLHIHELGDDYTCFTGKWTRIFPGGNNEAPAVFKKDGKYYLISSGCTGWDPNAARSAVADSIWGPWEALGNPCVGKDAEGTFHSQSTYVLPVAGKKDAFIFMADRWTPRNPIDGRYIWLPIQFSDGRPLLEWRKKWSLDEWAG